MTNIIQSSLSTPTSLRHQLYKPLFLTNQLLHPSAELTKPLEAFLPPPPSPPSPAYSSSSITSFSLTSSSYQPYHLVAPSPWPFLTSASLLPTALSFIAYLHGLQLPALALFLPLLSTTLILTLWLKDILRESILEGSHGTSSLYSQRTGILLFIASEVALFTSFF